MSQELKILEKLREANGGYVNKQVFVREMFFTQAGRAIHNLQKHPERYGVDGVVEASPFTDQYGFKSYRLKKEARQGVMV